MAGAHPRKPSPLSLLSCNAFHTRWIYLATLRFNKKIFLVNFEIFKPTKYYLFYRYVFMNRIYLILTSMEDLLQSIFSIFIIFLKNSAVEDCITFISLWLWANYRHEVVTTFPLRSRNSKAPNFTIRMCVHPIVLILYIYYIYTRVRKGIEIVVVEDTGYRRRDTLPCAA